MIVFEIVRINTTHAWRLHVRFFFLKEKGLKSSCMNYQGFVKWKSKALRLECKLIGRNNNKKRIFKKNRWKRDLKGWASEMAQ